MGQKVVRRNRIWTDNSLFKSLIILCLFMFLVSSCENPFIEKVWGLKTITFDTNGGTGIPEQKLIKGERIIKPDEPAKSGCIFIGWYKDNETFMEEWDFGVIPDKDIILYAKWEEIAAVHYTLILDTNDLTENGDSVSFSASDVTLETSASGGSTVRIYYTLGNTHTNNWLLLYIDGDTIYETKTPGTGYYDYKVDPADADDFGAITIQAYSIHSNLNPLHPPAYLVFDKTGTISYTASNENPADTTYRFTLYRDDLEIDGFTNMPITSGSIPANIVNEMLKSAGDYQVKVWAATNDPGYDSSSAHIYSQKVNVYQVDVIFSGAISGDTVTVNETSHEAGFKFNVFSGDTVTLTANPGTNRYVTWSGAGSGTDKTRTVTVTGNTTVTAVFAVVPVIVTSGSASIGYNNLDDAFNSITTAGDYTVTLFANQSMTSTYTLPAGSNINLKLEGVGAMQTITYAAGTLWLFEVNANSSLTIGNNITIQGRLTAASNGLILVNSGTLTMEGNAEIRKHNVSGQLSAAIYITGSNGRFIMKGGTIAENNNTSTISATTGGVFINNGIFEMRGGSITDNTAGGKAEDVYIAVTTADKFIISGASNIGALKLNSTNATAFSSIHIGDNFSGNVGLSLRGNFAELVTVINWWEGKQILQGERLEDLSRRGISSSDVSKFTLENFYSSLDNSIQEITPSFYLEKTSGNLGILKIDISIATVIVNANGAETGYSGITTALSSITTSGDYIVTLKANQSMAVNYTLSNNSYINITLEGDSMRTISCNSASGSLFTINTNTSLTIGNNITIQGRSAATNSDLITIENGTLTMNGNSIIRGHNASNVLNAAICVGGASGSKFVMNGGTITGNNNTITETNAAGGVYVGPNSIFEMRGGNITNNTVGGTFTGNIFTGGINEDLYVTVTIADKFILSGNANIGSLKLNATSSISFGKVQIGNYFTGSVGKLHLRGNNTAMATAISYWVNNTILQGENINGTRRIITTDDVNKFTLENFYSSAVGESQAIGFSHYVNGSGVLVGKTIYDIGGTGPAGGIIFYRNPNGFTVQGYGSPSDEGYFAPYTAYYLEAAPENESGTSQWGAFGTLIADVTIFIGTSDSKASLIGNGRKDTRIIINHLGTSETGRAAQVCAGKSLSVYTDWFLPSLGELNEFYKLKGQAGVPQAGIPTTGQFWSSSQGNLDYAWVQNFDDGDQGASLKDYSGSVRAIRAF